MSVESIKLETLTPIFTGNIDGNSNTLQITSIIGSLRWWTETILRGLEYYACDPNSTNENDRCNEKNGYCHACSIFGSGGLGRMFKLDIVEQDLKPMFDKEIRSIRLEFKDGKKNRAWFIYNGLIGKFTIRIIPLRRYFDPILIKLPLVIASRYGSICAKTSLGYGIVKIIDYNNDIDIKSFIKALDNLSNNINIRKYNNDKLPNIKDFFFSKIDLDISNKDWWKDLDGFKELEYNHKQIIQEHADKFIPISFNIRKWLRYDSDLRCYTGIRYINRSIFGSINTKDCKKESSRINISFAYNIDSEWELRIWSWLNNNKLRNKVYEIVYKTICNILQMLQINKKDTIWHEFNSYRDPKGKKYDNMHEYVNSLITE
ncbi:MAG: CRISPR-associated protein Cmr1 [Candidatus Nitrosocaldaceae archaeon]|nr:MAG: CRISPR-associated protein Cmr1 [Candidatus Nitrosocaldaceae archaeon]